jgi:ketosteroid isomerase-like protein
MAQRGIENSFIHQTLSFMKTICSLFIVSSALLISCQQKPSPFTEEQKNQVADSARQVVQQIIDNSNKLDFKAALDLYSNDPDARFIENGTLFASLDVMRKTYSEMGPMLELLENKADQWDVLVLSKDAVLVTIPFHFRMKAKGLQEYNGQYLWSGVVQKRGGKWMIVHSHESWLNFAEATAALTPPPTKNKK